MKSLKKLKRLKKESKTVKQDLKSSLPELTSSKVESVSSLLPQVNTLEPSSSDAKPEVSKEDTFQKIIDQSKQNLGPVEGKRKRGRPRKDATAQTEAVGGEVSPQPTASLPGNAPEVLLAMPGEEVIQPLLELPYDLARTVTGDNQIQIAPAISKNFAQQANNILQAYAPNAAPGEIAITIFAVSYLGYGLGQWVQYKARERVRNEARRQQNQQASQ